LWDLHLTHLLSHNADDFSAAFASFINLMDLSRPAVIGITTPGNSTMFRNGKIGSESGNSSLIISSSSWSQQRY
jgi:hypothetical protein